MLKVIKKILEFKLQKLSFDHIFNLKNTILILKKNNQELI